MKYNPFRVSIKPGNGWEFKIYMPEIKIDNNNKIIHRTVTGDLYTERSLKLVHELAFVVSNHKGYNVLLDMRETVTQPEMLDLMEIASTCTKLRSDFDSKIAILIPNTEERVKFAKLFKACMVAQGFDFTQFFKFENAMDWLSE